MSKSKSNGQKKEHKKQTGKNREIVILTCFFVGIFLFLIGYLIYFQVVRGEEIANSPYNRKRQNLLAEKVVRGEIVSANGEVLARTIVDEEGNETREYPYGRMFSHVVGYSLNGGSGLEAAYNIRLLRSHSFFLERIKNSLTDTKNIGDRLVTTLDTRLQTAAYDALGDNEGAIVVMRPKTGEVLAMVSKPDFNPNNIEEMWDYFTSEEGENDSSLVNRATQGLYPPGSTFKILTTLGYLKQNEDQYENYEYVCDGHIEVDGEVINCYHNTAHGTLNLRRSFALSCNSSFVHIGLSLNRKQMNSLCNSFLFNRNLPIVLPYSQSTFEMDQNMTHEKLMQTVIGQGDTLVTPLHMAMIVSAIANDGTMMAPYFIDHIENDSGDVVKTYKPSVAASNLLTKREAQILTDFMQDVIEEGTATSLKNDDYSVAGKTGSAEYGEEKGNSHSWFVCFAPASDPEIVVSVIIEGGGSGSDYGVPIARKVLNEYFYGTD